MIVEPRTTGRSSPCGKTEYATHKIAASVASKKSRERGVQLRFYKCPNCKNWHLTSMDRWGRGGKS